MYGTMPGASRLDGKSFMVFTYIWLEDVAKISKVPGAPGNNTLSIGVTINGTIFQ